MTLAAKNAAHFPRDPEPSLTCDSVHCVTCADEAVPMRVVEVGAAGLARCVDEAGLVTDVMTALVPNVGTDDCVLVHAGVALALAESPKDFRR